MKQVLAHNHALSLMDLYWRGGSAVAKRHYTLPSNYPYWRLCFHITCAGVLAPRTSADALHGSSSQVQRMRTSTTQRNSY